MKKLFCLLMCVSLSVLASEKLLDFGINSPDSRVIYNNEPFREYKLSSAKNFTAILNLSVPEFDKGDLLIDIWCPEKNRVTGMKIKMVTEPGMFPHAFSGKIFQTESVNIDSSKTGKQTIRFPLNIRNLLKIDTRPFPVHITGIELTLDSDKDKNSSFYLGAISVEPKGLYCRFSTGQKLAVCDLGKKNEVPQFTVFHKDSVPCKGRFEYIVTDFSGNTVEKQQISREFKANDSVELPMKKPFKAGVYYIAYKITKEGEDGFSHSRKISYAAMLPTGKYHQLFSDNFLFSVCEHLPRYNREEQLLLADYMVAAGIHHVRAAAPLWFECEPQPNVSLKWPEEMYQLLIDRNIEVQGNLLCPPDWATDTEWLAKKWGGIRKPDYKLYSEYVKRYVAKHKGKIRMFENFNEVNLYTKFWNVASYGEYEAVCHKALKEGNPDALMLSGSWAGVMNNWSEQYYAKYPDHGDILAYHYHGRFDTDVNEILYLNEIIRKDKLKQRWFANECAWSSLTDDVPAETLFKKLIFSWAQGSIGYTWYNLRDKGWDPKDGEHHYGLLTQDMYPRASYVVYNALTGVYRDAKYLNELKIKPDLFAFRFERGNNVIFPMWTMSRDYGTQTLVFRTNAKSAEIVDMFGNAEKIGIVNGVFAAGVSNRPVSLRLTPTTATLEYIAPLMVTEQKVVAIAGTTQKYRFELKNPLDKEETFDLLLDLPKELNANPVTQKITVAPNSKAIFSTDIAAAANFSATSNVKAQIVLKVKNPELAGKMEFLIQPTVMIKSNNGAGHALLPCITREQYTSIVEGKLGADKLYWNGVNDLSAWGCVFYPNMEYLNLRVVVEDDIHNQPFHGSEMFNGDSLQLMFLLPNQKSQWEIGISWHNDNNKEAFIWMAPPGFDKASVAKEIKVVAYYRSAVDPKASKNTIWYEIKIPLKAVGTSLDELKRYGFRFNLIINDNDGPCREGYLSFITGDPKKADNFPVIILEK